MPTSRAILRVVAIPVNEHSSRCLTEIGPVMPHTVAYRPMLIEQMISSHRIASYSKVFSTASDMELVGVYL